MIRRSPTRIELKLEDLNDFDYIQKFEKKKNPSGSVVSCGDTQKLVRQERIGLGFRPVRASSNVGASQSGSFTTPPAIGPGTTAAAGDIVLPVTPTDNDNAFEMNVTASNSAAEGLNVLLEEDRPNVTTNTSNMSLDESL